MTLCNAGTGHSMHNEGTSDLMKSMENITFQIQNMEYLETICFVLILLSYIQKVSPKTTKCFLYYQGNLKINIRNKIKDISN